MRKFKIKKIKKFLIIFIVFLFLLTIYLNRAYAHIYNKIGQVALSPCNQLSTYFIAKKKLDQRSISETSSSSLIYLALGDSLTAGVGIKNYQDSYPYLLAQNFALKDNIILKTEAVSGERTAGFIKNLLPSAIKDNPDIITLLIGINDIHGNVSLASFQKNYDYILKELSSKTKAKIYLINLPYLGSESLFLPPYNYLVNIQTKRFNKIIKNLAHKYSLNYIDLYSSSFHLNSEVKGFYAADSFHPAAPGYKLWAQLIYASIYN